MRPTPNQDPGSYFDMRAKLRLKMKHDGQLKERILAAFTKAYEQAIQDSQIVLARPEKKRLFSQLLEDILTEIINETRAPKE